MKARTDSSGPSRNSSTSTVAAAAQVPKQLLQRGVELDPRDVTTNTPLPAAQAVGLEQPPATPSVRSRCRPPTSESTTSARAVGMPWRRRKSFVQALLHSSRAAARVGPKALSPMLREVVDQSLGQRRFGADDGQVDALAAGVVGQASRRPAPQWARCAVFRRCPAQRAPSRTGADRCHAIACSRPPEPTTRTLIAPCSSILGPCSARQLLRQSVRSRCADTDQAQRPSTTWCWQRASAVGPVRYRGPRAERRLRHRVRETGPSALGSLTTGERGTAKSTIAFVDPATARACEQFIRRRGRSRRPRSHHQHA